MKEAIGRTTSMGIVVAVALLAVFFLGRNYGGASPEEVAREEQKQMELLPMRIASSKIALISGMLVQGAAAASVGWIILSTAVTFGKWLNTRSRLVHQKNGLFPLIRGEGVWYDANRAAGDNPYVSIAALKVQDTVARASLSRGNGGYRETPPAFVEEERPQLPNYEDESSLLPSRISAEEVMRGSSPSVHSLILGVESGPDGVVTRRESLLNLSHVGIGGSSGWGKSLFLRWLGWQLLQAAEPVDLVLVDVEAVTLQPFSNSSKLLYPLASEDSAIRTTLGELAGNELNLRKERFVEVGASSLSQYNAVAESPFNPVACLIDETAMLGDDKRIVDSLQELALRGRKYGLFLVCASQDWKANVFDTRLTNQMSSRFQFGCRNGAQSRVLMGESGAENFSLPGRCMAQLKGSKTITLQVPEISEEALRKIPRGDPRKSLPVVIDVPNADDPSLPAEERIIRMHSRGCPQSEIESAVFGHTGGNAWRKVKDTIAKFEERRTNSK